MRPNLSLLDRIIATLFTKKRDKLGSDSSKRRRRRIGGLLTSMVVGLALWTGAASDLQAQTYTWRGGVNATYLNTNWTDTNNGWTRIQNPAYDANNDPTAGIGAGGTKTGTDSNGNLKWLNYDAWSGAITYQTGNTAPAYPAATYTDNAASTVIFNTGNLVGGTTATTVNVVGSKTLGTMSITGGTVANPWNFNGGTINGNSLIFTGGGGAANFSNTNLYFTANATSGVTFQGGDWTIGANPATGGAFQGHVLTLASASGTVNLNKNASFRSLTINGTSTWNLNGSSMLNVTGVDGVRGTMNLNGTSGNLNIGGTASLNVDVLETVISSGSGGTWAFNSTTGGTAPTIQTETLTLGTNDSSATRTLNVNNVSFSGGGTVNHQGGFWTLSGAGGNISANTLNLRQSGTNSLNIINGFDFAMSSNGTLNVGGNWTFNQTGAGSGSIAVNTLHLNTTSGSITVNGGFTVDAGNLTTSNPNPGDGVWSLTGTRTGGTSNFTIDTTNVLGIPTDYRFDGKISICDVDFIVDRMIINGGSVAILGENTQIGNVVPIPPLYANTDHYITGRELAINLNNNGSLAISAEMRFSEGIYFNTGDANGNASNDPNRSATIVLASVRSLQTVRGEDDSDVLPVFGTYNYAQNLADATASGNAKIMNRNVVEVASNLILATEANDAYLENRWIINENVTLTFANPLEAFTTSNTNIIYITNVNAVGSAAGGVDTQQGGAIYLKAGANISRRQPTATPNGYGQVVFLDNEADKGAAIYAMQSLTIEGNMVFDGNESQLSGGAIYMAGTKGYGTSIGSNNVLTIDTGPYGSVLGANIVFTGNTMNNATATTPNSIYLEKNIYVNFTGDYFTFIEDGIAGGYNNTMDVNIGGEGFVQFGSQSRSELVASGSIGGTVNVNDGTFRVVGDNDPAKVGPYDPTLIERGKFDTLGINSVFTVGTGGKLSGGGQIRAGGGFVFNGEIAPDFFGYEIPSDLKNFDLGISRENEIYGDLVLGGNVLFDDATYSVDTDRLGAADPLALLNAAGYKQSDRITVQYLDAAQRGKVTFGAQSTIDVQTWFGGGDGKYLIMTADTVDGGGALTGGGIDATNDTIMEYFKIENDGNGFTGRQTAMLTIEYDVLGNQEDDLVLHTTNKGNIYLVWDGTPNNVTGDVWHDGETQLNWYRRGSAADIVGMRNTALTDTSMERAFFMDGDYVFFGESAREKDVRLTDDWIVTGMEILGGDYEFDDFSISGVMADPVSGERYIGVVPTAKLIIDGYNSGGIATRVTFVNTTTNFDRGTELSNGATVVIHNGGALGTYDEVYNDHLIDPERARGVVSVVSNRTDAGGNAIASTATIQTASSLIVRQHYEIDAGNTLILDLLAGSTYTIGGVDTTDSTYRGGAVHVGRNSNLVKQGAGSVLRFDNNTAINGGAIYAERDLTVYGGTAFINNTADTLGGAIYMGGTGTLLFDTADGNVVFDGNEHDGGTLNSVYLNRTNMQFMGTNAVLFNDPIASAAAGVTQNTLTTAEYDADNGTGFDGTIQFLGGNALNNANGQASVDLQGGTLRLAADAAANPGVFDIGGAGVSTNALTLGTAATLAGQGTFIVPADGQGFIINGTLSPDSDTLYSKLDGNHATDHLVVGELSAFANNQALADAAKIGTLTFDGKMSLDGARLQVDLADSTQGAGVDNDLIDVTGIITVVGMNTVDATKVTGFDPTDGFMIMVGNQIVDSTGVELTTTTVTDYFTLNLTDRQDGDLEIRTGGIPGGTQLWIANFTDGANARVYWTGAYTSATNMGNGDWDLDTTKNWTDSSKIPELTFLANDYVIFDQSYLTGDEETDVYLTGPMTTAGMELVSGSYTFTGAAVAVIEGVAGNIGGTATTGTFLVNGGEATLGLATNFVGGTEMNGGRINIADDAALGVYVHQDFIDYVLNPAAGSKTGFINVAADGTIGTVFDNSGAGAVNDFTVVNRFHVEPAAAGQTSTLTFDLAAGTTLTIDGVDVRGDNSDGGAIFLEAGGALASAATNAGTLILTNNKAENGGAIFTTDALTLDGNWQFGTVVVAPAPRTGNDATFDGGAIYASDDLTINGTANFVGNFAGQDGGAINAVGDVTLNGLTSFEFNTALRDGGAINADNVTINANSQFGGAVFATQRNYAEVNGGAINATNAVTINALMAFQNNQANTGSGGAINAGTTVDILDTVNFADNTAGTSGGAINAGGNVTLDGVTTFDGNTAGTDGGAIFSAADVTINAAAEFGTTTLNTAQSGGAIAAQNVTVAATAAGTVFENNTATAGAGGAINVNNVNGLVEILGDTDFTLNTATMFGGAINTNGDVTIGATVTNFDRNHADFLGGAINADGEITITGEANFTGNTAGAGGGAINNAGVMETTLAGVTTFTQNTAGAGGAINTGGDLTIGAAATFTENEATGLVANSGEGGAIKSTADVTIGGGTQFLRNEAGRLGGAIYMAGGVDEATRKILTLDADGADITFDGNNIGGVLNSVHLNQFVDLVVDGANDVYFNDPLSGGNNNNFTKNGAGTVFFSGDSVLNTAGLAGGAAALNVGTMRLVNGATFDAGDDAVNSVFTQAAGAILDGNGAITAGGGFTINGTITPGENVGDMVDIMLVGNTIFDGATLIFDLAAVGQTDTITIDGDLTFGATVNTIQIRDYVTGTYDIIFNDLNLLVADPDWKDHFTVDLVNGTLTPRQGVTLQLTDVNTTIQLVLGDLSLALLWIGDASRDWNEVEANETWMTLDGSKARSGFLNNDYVIFDYDLASDPVDGIGPTATQGDVNIAGDYIVAGMEIKSGDYTFDGVGSITGDAANSNVDFVTYTSRERLTISGGKAVMNVATNFLGGTEMSGGTVVLGNAAALGVYDHQNYLDYVNAAGTPTASMTGYVNITGNATVGATTTRTAQNRFNVNAPAGAELTFDIATGQTLTFDGVDVVDGFAAADQRDGGVIFLGVDNTLARTGDGTLAFTNNKARSGGAIYNDGNAEMILDGTTTFTNNTADAHGGAVYSNGAITTDGTVVFTGNEATTGSGGAIWSGAVTLNGDRAEFVGNTAGVHGGAINAGGKVTVNVTEALFDGNIALRDGGAIYNLGGVETVLQGDVTFTGNEATTGDGGAIRTTGDVITDGITEFANNTAGRDGGAIYTDASVTTDGTTLFTENEATAGSGGAIWSAGTVTFNGDQVEFVRNTAGTHGGAINAGGKVTINVTDILFDGNIAAQDGGAIYNLGGVETVLNGDVLFTDNTAGRDGGAIYTIGDVTTDGTTLFTGNEATIGSGGAIWGGAVTLNGDRAEFVGNTAGIHGGAINAGGKVTINVTDALFDGNSAVRDGGAIYNLGGVETVFQGDVTFTGNEALLGSGGAIHTTGDVTMDGTALFANNSAALDGGAIKSDTTVTINASSVFEDNTAGGSGGAIHANQVAITTGGTVFQNNEAAVSGGAIELVGAAGARGALTLDADGADIIFDNNTGGALHANGFTDLAMSGDSRIFFGAADTILVGDLNGNSTLDIDMNGGSVIMNADATVTGGPTTVTSGTLFLGNGVTFTADGTGTFGLATGAKLSGSGTVASPNMITIAGTLDANSDTYTYNQATGRIGTITHTATPIGTFTFDGDTTFDEALLLVDLGAGNTSDLYIVTGDLTTAAADANKVTLSGWQVGVFDIVDAGNVIDQDHFYIDPNNFGARNKAELQLKAGDDTILQVVTTELNPVDNLLWTGATDDIWVDWNSSKVNWITEFSPAGEELYFLNGDSVIFTDNATYVMTKDVVMGGDVEVTGMKVLDAEYTFTGAGYTITGLTDADLEITNAGATFDPAVLFDRDIIITADSDVVFNNGVTAGNDLTVDNSTLSVTGTTTVGNNYTLDHSNADHTGDLAVTGNLLVNQAAGAESGAFTVTGNTTIDGFAKMAEIDTVEFGPLTVTGSDDGTDAGIGLSVDGVASFTVDGDAKINHHTVVTNVGDVRFENNLTIGNGSVSSLIAVDGDSFTVVGDTDIRGFASFQDVTDINFANLDITAWLEVNTIVGPSSSFISTGTANIGGNTTLENVETIEFGVLNVGGDLLVDNSNLADSGLTVDGDMTVTGGVKLENVKTMTFGGDVTINGKYGNNFESLLVNAVNYNTASAGTSDSLTVAGNATNLGDVVIFNVGNVDFQGNLTTTDAGTDGYLILQDVGTFHVGGDANIANQIALTNVASTTVDGDLVSQRGSFTVDNRNLVGDSDLTVTGDTDIALNASIRSVTDTTFGGTLTVGGDLLVDNTGLADSTLTVDGDMTVTGGVKLENVKTMTFGGDVTANTLSVNTVNGTQSDSLTIEGSALITGLTDIRNVASATIEGDSTFGGGLNITASNVTLNGDNTNDIGTQVFGVSVLTLGNDRALGLADLTVNDGSQTTLTSLTDREIDNNILNNGELTVDMTAGTTFTYNGAMTGIGDFVKDGDGTLTITGNGNSIDGTLTVENGILQLDPGSSLEFGGAATLKDTSYLTGSGSLTASQIVLSGGISAGNLLPGGHDLGSLNMTVTNGQVLLDGADIDLYIASGNQSNTIDVDGKVGFVAGADLNTVNLVNDWIVGEYTVIETTDGFDGTTDYVISQFGIVYKGDELGKRQQAHINLEVQDKNLVLTIEEMKRYEIEWKGQNSNQWNTATENWVDPVDGRAMNFMDRDYAIFNDNALTYDVQIQTNYDVAGMSIDANTGKYVFSGGTITGKITDDGFSTGRLDIYSTDGHVTINNTMSFEDGIRFVGGGQTTVVLGSNTALGTTGNAKEGYVTIDGNKDVTFTSTVAGTTNLQNRFDSKGGSMTFTTGSWSFTNNAQSGPAEIITSAGDVTINGNATFTNQNAQAKNGWAIDMADGTELVLNASTGDFDFTGSAKAAVMLNGNNTMTLAGKGDFNFSSGINGTGSNALLMNGSGNLNLNGTNSIGSTQNARALINSGTLNMADGTSLSVGSGQFQLNGAELVSTGRSTVTATGGIELTGIIDVRSSNGTFGVLALNGNTTMDTVDYRVQWNENGSSTIDVAGNVDFDGANVLRLDDSGSWYNGTYELIYASGTMDDASTWSIYFGSRDVTTDNRYQAVLETTTVGGENVLLLTTAGLNIGLTWTNGSGNGLWDTSSENWIDDGGRNDMFMQGDDVTFDGRGTGTVQIVSGGVTVSDVTVTAGNYRFTGGSITGTKNGTSLGSADADLSILGGSVEIDTTAKFEGDILISGNQTSVGLTENGRLQAEGTFTLEKGTTLEIVPAEGSIKGSSVTLNGTVLAHRPTLDVTTTLIEIEKVIEATETRLDTVSLREIFDISYGLTDQSARFSSNQRIMDLIYARLTPYEFSLKHGLSTNERNLAGALTDTFAGQNLTENMELLRDYLYGLQTSEEVAEVIDQMRGSEIYADALTMALWSPWKKVFKELDRLDYCSEGPYLGQKKNRKLSGREFWFEGYYRHLKAHGDGNAHRYEEKRGGLMLGTDAKLSYDAMIGLTFGYGNPRLNNQFAKVEAEDYTLGLYGRTRVTSNSHLNAFLGMGGQENLGERYETALGQKYDAKYDSYSMYASLEWVRPVKFDRIKLLPLFALDYQRAWSDKFQETGGAYAQSVGKADMDMFIARFGLNSTLFSAGKASFKTRFQYGYLIGGDKRGTIQSAFASNPAGPFMNLHGVNIGRNRLNVGLGGEYLLKMTRFFWEYDYDCSDHTDAHTGQIGVSTLW